jgi:hypothetical protein
MYAIKRPINGISINGNEYLLDEFGIVILFDTRQEAMLSLEGIDAQIAEIIPTQLESFVHMFRGKNIPRGIDIDGDRVDVYLFGEEVSCAFMFSKGTGKLISVEISSNEYYD